ncbi:MAG TPA: hypothetical protein PLJ74_12940 [Myxococcota bacterium]|nr:hypothetical protein [Myxococcota bacterium]
MPKKIEAVENGSEEIKSRQAEAERQAAEYMAARAEKVKKAMDELKKLGLSDDTINLLLLGL